MLIKNSKGSHLSITLFASYLHKMSSYILFHQTAVSLLGIFTAAVIYSFCTKLLYFDIDDSNAYMFTLH